MNSPARTWLSALPLLLAACTTVADAGDPTPPEVTLSYRLNGDSWSEVPAEGVAVSMGMEDTLDVQGEARDVDGVFFCAVRGDGRVRCTGRTGVSLSAVNLYEKNVAPDDAGAGDDARTQRSAHLTVTRASLCETGDPSDTTLVFRAYGMNFGQPPGTATTAELTVRLD